LSNPDTLDFCIHFWEADYKSVSNTGKKKDRANVKVEERPKNIKK
jgi:hypothetical protein